MSERDENEKSAERDIGEEIIEGLEEAADYLRDREYEKLLDDVGQWERRELGADPQHARRSSPGRREEIDEKLGLKGLTLRIKAETFDELERRAEEEGVILRALVRRILDEYVDRAK